MKAFARLYAALDETTKTNEKVAALVDYFRIASPADAAWAVHFLIGRRPKRLIPARRLAELAAERAGVPMWLFEESYDAVGDLAETIALLLPGEGSEMDEPLSVWVEDRLLALAGASEDEQREALVAAWDLMGPGERLVWNKLITGAFRVGVSQELVTRALAKVSDIEAAVIAHRLMGDWTPSGAFFEQVVASDTADADSSKPYPFVLAYPWEGDSIEADLGPIQDWQIEWKWDGIRGQLIRRRGESFLWSRGEELITDRFPEITDMAEGLPDGTVLDGEVLPWHDGMPLPCAILQRRIGRKTLNKKILAEAPVVLIAYDYLEAGGEDIRELPLAERRERLAALVETLNSPALIISPVVSAPDWETLHTVREESRDRAVEGMMIKRRDAAYRVGRKRGDWWKWKIAPFTVDAVLIYAQRGSGKRASLYTDYTFGVWDDGKLVPFAKAYSGLTDAEIAKVDAFVRRNTLERFGPVRTVAPQLVFELAFEGIQLSSRHKSGIAVRFPRMARWRTDKKPEEADSLETIRALITSSTDSTTDGESS